MKYLIGLLLIFPSVLFAQETRGLMVKKGGNGNYIMLGGVVQKADKSNGIESIEAYRILNGKEVKIGSFNIAKSATELKKYLSATTIAAVAKFKKISESQVPEYMMTHTDLKDYGMLGLSLGFLKEVGSVIADEDLSADMLNQDIEYKIVVTINGKKESLSSIASGSRIMITPKPIAIKRVEKDSMISITWSQPQRGSDEVLFGNVYRRTGYLGKFELVRKIFADKSFDKAKLTFTMIDKVKPNVQYDYFVIPVSMLENPGTFSDTVLSISRDFENISQPNKLTVTDTTGALYLSWNKVAEEKFLSKIVIERSTNAKERYKVLDTVAVNAWGYTDNTAQPGMEYFYRIRAITIRNNALGIGATTSGRLRSSRVLIVAPKLETINATAKGIQLTWSKVDAPDLDGYFVYRQHPDSNVYQLVSPLLTKNSFSDTSVHNAKLRYAYQVRSVNLSQIESEASNTLYASPFGKIELDKPNKLLAMQNGNVIMVRWDETQSSDDWVKGYNIYRKSSTQSVSEGMSAERLVAAGFEKLNDAILSTPYFEDRKFSNNDDFQYVVTSVSQKGDESVGSAPYILSNNANRLAPVSEVYVRQTVGGVAISWDEVKRVENLKYEIYRRAANATASEKVGTVNGNVAQYTDKSAKPGQRYFYGIKVVSGSKISALSAEKSVQL